MALPHAYLSVFSGWNEITTDKREFNTHLTSRTLISSIVKGIYIFFISPIYLVKRGLKRTVLYFNFLFFKRGNSYPDSSLFIIWRPSAREPFPAIHFARARHITGKGIYFVFLPSVFLFWLPGEMANSTRLTSLLFTQNRNT